MQPRALVDTGDNLDSSVDRDATAELDATATLDSSVADAGSNRDAGTTSDAEIQVDAGPRDDASTRDAAGDSGEPALSIPRGVELDAAGGGKVLWPDHEITRPTGRVEILPLGDSITQGGALNGEVSYRHPLWQRLVDADADFDFIGSMTTGFNGDPAWPDYNGLPFDRENEGHWGWTLNALRDQLSGWLSTYTPDVVLVTSGSNDVAQGDSPANMATEVGQIFELLRADNPNVIIVWGQPFQEWDPFPAFRTAVRTLAMASSTTASPIIVVDHSPGWISNPETSGTHTIDWVHTNPAGDEKLALNWLSALRPLLGLP